MEAPLLDNEGGGAEDKSGLPSWLDPEKDDEHTRSLLSDGNARTSSSSWADDPVPPRQQQQQQSELPKLILGVRILNMGAAIALITCSVSHIVFVLFVGGT